MKREKNSKNNKENDFVQHSTEISQQSGSSGKAIIFGSISLIFTVLYFYSIHGLFPNFTINSRSVLGISILMGVVTFGGFYRSDVSIKQIAYKIVLFMLLFYFFLVQFLEYTDKIKGTEIIYKLERLEVIMLWPSITIAILTLWMYRERFNQNINRQYLKTTDDHNTKIREGVLKYCFNKSEILYTTAFIFILGVSFFSIFYKLDGFDLYSDESTTMRTAAGFYHTGKFEYWSFVTDQSTGIYDNRALPHHFIIGLFYHVFGISTWSTHLPSALFSVLFIILIYFFGRKFLKDPLSALAVAFSFSMFYEFLVLGRWARMYALIFPLFLVLVYYFYRFITEKYQTIKSSNRFKSILKNSFNYNYRILPILIILLALNFTLHINTSIILAFIFFYALALYIVRKEWKYLIILAFGILFILSESFFGPLLFSHEPLTLFEADNTEYYTGMLFAYPFGIPIGVIFLISGFTGLFFVKNSVYKERYILLYIIAILSWILFARIISFSPSFRYISFISVFVVFIIIAQFFTILRSIYGRFILIPLIILVLATVGLQFKSKFQDLYVSNPYSPSYPSVAWEKISKQYKAGEIVLRHWGPEYYFDSIDKNAIVKTIGSGKKDLMNLNEFTEILNEFPSGWITWLKTNETVIDKNIRQYVKLYFQKESGYGLDTLGVEIFRYKKSMLRDTVQFQFERNLPNANLNIKDEFSLSFVILMRRAQTNEPFFFTKDGQKVISLIFKPEQDSSLVFEVNPGDKFDLVVEGIKRNELYRVLIIHKKESDFSRLILYIDGEQAGILNIPSNIDSPVKFKVNPEFTGILDNIQFFNSALKPDELVKMQAIFQWQKK